MIPINIKNKITVSNTVFFIILLLLFFLPQLIFGTDTNLYQEITLPKFAPPSWLFGIVWPILYILIAISSTIIFTKFNKNEASNYYEILFINYLLNILFPYLFFDQKNLTLGFIITAFVFVTAIFLFLEALKLDKCSAYLLIPYIVWTFFATILSYTIYIIN